MVTETEHVLLLRKGADAWNAWRQANPSIHADLREANLNGANLQGTFLRGADLRKANLNRANLSRANLGSAMLTNANVSRANFNEANLSAADLTGSNLSLANFTGATLSDADLSGTSLSGALLRGANLSGAKLGSANLSGANLSRAYLSGAVLEGANLRGADLGGATLIGAKFMRANLSLADLSRANLSGADLDTADLNGANLDGSNFGLANLSNAQLTGVHWQLRTMRGCYLGIRGLDSCFGNAVFKRAAADQDFLDTLEAHVKGTRRMALFHVWGWIDYGRSLLRVAAISFGLAAVYGAIYRIFPQILDFRDSANTWFTPYYFSIVTYTTLGFRCEAGHSGGRDNCQQRGNSRLHDTRFAPFRPRAKHRAPQLSCDQVLAERLRPLAKPKPFYCRLGRQWGIWP
jgi:uncharacterized protein YjbI with pentapeptide repeats